MTDKRRHRGPAPEDREIFAAERVPVLVTAVEELSWLLGRGYPENAALKMVGDRHALTARQRTAVSRSTCSDITRDARRGRRVAPSAARTIDVDGFNCIILCESILSGAPVFVGRDLAHRDLASVHGTWRRVNETARAIDAAASLLRDARSVRFLLDRPISNSGRLAAMLRDRAAAAGLPWEVLIVDSPDPLLAASEAAVASADAWVLDRCRTWTDIPAALAARERSAWVIDLSGA